MYHDPFIDWQESSGRQRVTCKPCDAQIVQTPNYDRQEWLTALRDFLGKHDSETRIEEADSYGDVHIMMPEYSALELNRAIREHEAK